jgi:hypothetical protein
LYAGNISNAITYILSMIIVKFTILKMKGISTISSPI